VICVDGPTASGKGTLAAVLAKQLGYHLLDSGSLYRITALAATQRGLNLDAAHESAIAQLVQGLTIQFTGGRVVLDGADVSDDTHRRSRHERIQGIQLAPGRLALIDLQHSFASLPGLVADGRDMGTVIFPDATLKVFLTASAQNGEQSDAINS
jgi:3-phosphoshikimate 1-carboxyvinyltransferase